MNNQKLMLFLALVTMPISGCACRKDREQDREIAKLKREDQVLQGVDREIINRFGGLQKETHTGESPGPLNSGMITDQPGEWVMETEWLRDPTTGKWSHTWVKRPKVTVVDGGPGSQQPSQGGGQGPPPTQPAPQPVPQPQPAPGPALQPQLGPQVGSEQAAAPSGETQEQLLNRILDERERNQHIAELEEGDRRNKRKNEVREVLDERGVATRDDLEATEVDLKGHMDSRAAVLKQSFDSHVRMSNPTQHYVIHHCYEFSPGMCKFPCGVYPYGGCSYPYRRSFYNGCYHYYFRLIPTR